MLRLVNVFCSPLNVWSNTQYTSNLAFDEVFHEGLSLGLRKYEANGLIVCSLSSIECSVSMNYVDTPRPRVAPATWW